MRGDFRNKIWTLGRKKKTAHVSALAPLINTVSAVDIVLYNIFALVLQSPAVLKDERIYNEFIELELEHEALDTIRMHILTLYTETEEVNLQAVEKLSQNSSFFDVFVLLSSRSAPFIDKISIESQTLNPKDLWKLWIKQHECELLKKEYTAALSKVNDDNAFEKARIYMQQIAQQENELKIIAEEMFG